MNNGYEIVSEAILVNEFKFVQELRMSMMIPKNLNALGVQKYKSITNQINKLASQTKAVQQATKSAKSRKIGHVKTPDGWELLTNFEKSVMKKATELRGQLAAVTKNPKYLK